MATATVRNGVDVAKLVNKIEEVKRDPAEGRIVFRVRSQWKGGFRAQHFAGDFEVGRQAGTHAQPHSIASDEPREILGSDSGISPAEITLAALASCLSVGYAANAAAQGITIDELRFEISGHGDLQGFMNLNDVPPGLRRIEVKTYIKSDAPREQLQALHEYVNEHSPIWDTLANPVNIHSQLIVR